MPTLKKIGAALLLVALAVVFVYALSIGLEKQDRADCLKWRQYAAEYSQWYATAAERNQCEALGQPLPPNRGELVGS